MKNPKNILISGAGSGIGRALAVAYSKADVNLFLCGRNLEKLQVTKILCEELKANVLLEIADVCDELAMKNWIEKIEENHELDLVIANAGKANIYSFQYIVDCLILPVQLLFNTAFKFDNFSISFIFKFF